VVIEYDDGVVVEDRDVEELGLVLVIESDMKVGFLVLKESCIRFQHGVLNSVEVQMRSEGNIREHFDHSELSMAYLFLSKYPDIREDNQSMAAWL
jgi:hypothetical protein